MLDTIQQLLSVIPASFWGVVVGSFFSIAGVAITTRASDMRLRAQFEHERESKTKDREMSLRKDVFLSAAEAVVAGMNSIGRFANFDIPNDQLTEPYVEKAPLISKVHVIARTETILPLAQLQVLIVLLCLNAIVQVTVHARSCRIAKVCVLVLSVLYGLFFLAHNIVHMVGGEPLGLQSVLDFTHHALAGFAIWGAWRWQKAA